MVSKWASTECTEEPTGEVDVAVLHSCPDRTTLERGGGQGMGDMIALNAFFVPAIQSGDMLLPEIF